MRIATATSLDSLAAAWDELVDHTGDGPFLRPGWLRAWWAAYGRGELRILCAWRGAELAGVLPLAMGRRPRSPTNSESFRYGIVADDDAARRALLQALFAARPARVSCGFLDAEREPLAAWREVAAQSGSRVLVRVRARSPVVRIDRSWEAYAAARSKNLRADLGRCRRRLAELGEVTVAVACDANGAERALGELLTLEAAGWKGERGTAIAARPAARALYGAVTAWAAARGTLRLYSLRVDQRPVGALLALEESGCLYAMKSGYDPALARCSPGKLLLDAVIERAFAAGLERVELLGVDDPYKLRWANAASDSLELEAFGPRPGARVAYAVHAHGRPLARRLRIRRLITVPRG